MNFYIFYSYKNLSWSLRATYAPSAAGLVGFPTICTETHQEPSFVHSPFPGV